MHHMTFSMQIGVVDQVVFEGAGVPSAIALDPAALGRAELLGRNVAEQAGRSFDEVEFRGEPGLCPMCHLNAIVLLDGGAVECATCGAGGRLTAEGTVVFDDAAAVAHSVLTVAEKHDHFLEVQQTAVRQFAQGDAIAAGVARLHDYDRTLSPQRPPAPA
jgi:hypothetical protein